MGAESRTIDGLRARFERWEPEKQLPAVSQEDARYSRGFLAADPLAWFPSLSDHWKPLFHSLGADVVLESATKTMGRPPELEYAATIDIDGERGQIGLTEGSASAIIEAVAPDCPEEAATTVVDYMIRRLVATFAKSWRGVEPLNCSYREASPGRRENTLASVVLELLINGNPACFWLMLGPRAVEKLDGAWRLLLLQANFGKGENVLSDHIFRIGVELTELAVPPAMLIDYMRGGTIIDLEVPVSNTVQVKVDDELWAEGELCQFRGTLAVRIRSTCPAPRVFAESTTKVRVEIAQTELDNESLLEQGQQGAILLSDTPVTNRASLIISGENVATALVGMIEDKFALKVLPK